MECDFDISAPCLLDELMDSNILKCDVEFGMTIDSVFASKSSPSHESDSGCSDMSDIRSVSPVSDVGFLSPEMEEDDQVKLFDFESVASVESVEELDKELESYLAEPLNMNIHPRLNDSEIHSRPSIKYTDPASPEVNVDSDSNDIPDIMQTKRIIQSRAIVTRSEVGSADAQVKTDSKPNATIIKLPVSTNTKPTDIHIVPATSTSNVNRSSAPAIKVVKVVKTCAKSKQDIDNELIQALEDRNRKNAVQAKLNREKKKAYIQSLEDEIESLKCENFTLKESKKKADSEKQELMEEVQYLRSVLANQSMLSGLLKNIGNVGNVKMSSSIGEKRSADLDHDYHNLKRAKLTAGNATAGVCLHVDQGNVSLEFCSKCAKMAKSSENE